MISQVSDQKRIMQKKIVQLNQILVFESKYLLKVTCYMS